VDWNKSCTREQLLTARARQLKRKDDNVTKAAHTLARNRQQNKDFFDLHRHKRLEELGIRDLILLFNKARICWSSLMGRVKIAFPRVEDKKFYPRRRVDMVDE